MVVMVDGRAAVLHESSHNLSMRACGADDFCSSGVHIGYGHISATLGWHALTGMIRQGVSLPVRTSA